MKYCQYCGAEIKDEARFCQNCGKQCRTDYQTDFSSAIKYNDGVYYDTTPVESLQKEEKPALAITSLVLSILGFGLVGFILGIITMVKYKTTKYKIMGLIALIISIIWTVVAVISIYSAVIAIIQNGGSF